MNQASLWEVSHAFDLRASNVNLYWISCNCYVKLAQLINFARMLGIFVLMIMISPESGRIYHQAIVSKKLCGDSRYLTGVSKNIAAQHRDPDAEIKVCLIKTDRNTVRIETASNWLVLNDIFGKSVFEIASPGLPLSTFTFQFHFPLSVLFDEWVQLLLDFHW